LRIVAPSGTMNQSHSPLLFSGVSVRAREGVGSALSARFIYTHETLARQRKSVHQSSSIPTQRMPATMAQSTAKMIQPIMSARTSR
jgi:hypothetical protein